MEEKKGRSRHNDYWRSLGRERCSSDMLVCSVSNQTLSSMCCACTFCFLEGVRPLLTSDAGAGGCLRAMFAQANTLLHDTLLARFFSLFKMCVVGEHY